MKKVKVDLNELKKLMEEGKSANEICVNLNINRNSLAYYLAKLEYEGIYFNRVNYYTGVTTYNFDREENNNTILTGMNENKTKFLVISDLHFGNKDDRTDLVSKAFEYCKSKDIHYVLCGGDMIDGVYSSERKKIPGIKEQMQYFIDYYPYDKNITTFAINGDHDISANNVKNIITFTDFVKRNRSDIIMLDKSEAFVNIKNDSIMMFHGRDDKLVNHPDVPLVLRGHSHVYNTQVYKNKLIISLPALSNLGKTIPSALDLTLSFEKGIITFVNVKQILLEKENMILSSGDYDLTMSGRIGDDYIKNIGYRQEFIEDEQATYVSEENTLSQTEKFYKKWRLARA